MPAEVSPVICNFKKPKLLRASAYFPHSGNKGAWPDTSWESPPPSSLLSPFAHYGDLFMNTTGSGDYIPFTTPGVYFQCSTYTVFVWTVPLGCQLVLRLKSFVRFLRVDAHICGGFHAKSYNCSRAYDAIPWCFLKANTPPPNPTPCSLRFTPLPPLIHCSYWRQDMLASMRPALTESFFSFGS